MYVCINVCMSACMYVVYMHVCMYVCMFVCLHVFTYVCMLGLGLGTRGLQATASAAVGQGLVLGADYRGTRQAKLGSRAPGARISAAQAAKG